MSILLAALLSLQADVCVCGGCGIKPHIEVIGSCGACAMVISSRADKLCGDCARRGKACKCCGKGLGNPRVIVGAAQLVDKQPRPDATYLVIDGQGVYVGRARFGVPKDGRVLAWVTEEQKGVATARAWFPLGPAEKDLVVAGESAAPVSWRWGEIEGPAVPSVGGAYRVTLPGIEGATFDVVSGTTVLARRRFESGAWKTP